MQSIYHALLTLGFPSAPSLKDLTLPAPTTRRTVLQKVRGSTYHVVPQIVNTGFQVLFHSPPGVLFTFPSQYYTLSVTEEYLALRGGPRSFHQGSTCLDVLWIPLLSFQISLTGLSPSLAGFPKAIPLAILNLKCSPNPWMHAPRFGLFRFRSPLLPESMFLSLPPAT